MKDDEFTKLFKYMQEHFDDLESRPEQIANKQDVDRILNSLERLARQADVDDTERVALSVQVDRNEDWTEQAAPKFGISFKPGA